MTDYEIQRTDGINTYSRGIEDFPGSVAWFTGFAADANGIVWVGTWSQFTSTGSTLIRLNTNTGAFQTWSYDEGWPFPGEHVRPLTITPDGLLWMQYDSEYPSTDAGILWYDGENIGIYPSSPGGIPQWGGLPNSTISDLEVKVTDNGYELWMSCLGRGIAVLQVINDPVGTSHLTSSTSKTGLSAYPNPVSDKTVIRFSTCHSGAITLSFYDMHGKKVKEISENIFKAGNNTLEWDLCDQSGRKVAPGIYFARFSDTDRSASAKIVVR